MNIIKIVVINFLLAFNNCTHACDLCLDLLPLKATWIIQQLNEYPNEPIPFIGNMLTISGPSYSGKTTVACAIAHETQATLFTAQSLLPQDITALFDSVQNHIAQPDQRAIILIDSLESLCARAHAVSPENTAAGIMALRSHIKECAHNLRIFFIIIAEQRATIEQIIDMPCAANAIELTLPDEKKRRMLLNYLNNQSAKRIPDKLISYAAKKTNGFHLRALQTLAHEMAIATELLSKKRLSKEIPYLIATIKEQQCPQKPSDTFDRVCSVSQKIIPVVASAISAIVSIFAATKKG